MSETCLIYFHYNNNRISHESQQLGKTQRVEFWSIFSPFQVILINFVFFHFLTIFFQTQVKKIWSNFKNDFRTIFSPFQAISSNFGFFPFLTKYFSNASPQVSLKHLRQSSASGSCTLSTNEKPRSIVPECSRPIPIVPKPGGGGDRNPCFQTEPGRLPKNKKFQKWRDGGHFSRYSTVLTIFNQYEVKTSIILRSYVYCRYTSTLVISS